MTRDELLKNAKPILFNTEMVKATLNGRKTVTRRIMKPQPMFYTGRKYIFADDVCPKKWEDCDDIIKTYKYQPNDILYVREAFCPNYFDEGIARYREGDMAGNCNAYKADYRKKVLRDYVMEPKWRPSVQMPKEIARIFLSVTSVRVERLHDMTSNQAMDEGFMDRDWNDVRRAWDSTIKKSDLDRYGWNANPWVWVIEFERIEPEQ